MASVSSIFVHGQKVLIFRSCLWRKSCKKFSLRLSVLERRKWRRDIDRRQIHLSSSSGSSSRQTVDEKGGPIAYSKSQAKQHTVNDTLGIRESSSNVPLILGFGLFTILFYIGFIRKDSEMNWQKIFEMPTQQPEMTSLSHEESDHNSHQGKRN